MLTTTGAGTQVPIDGATILGAQVAPLVARLGRVVAVAHPEGESRAHPFTLGIRHRHAHGWYSPPWLNRSPHRGGAPRLHEISRAPWPAATAPLPRVDRRSPRLRTRQSPPGRGGLKSYSSWPE